MVTDWRPRRGSTPGTGWPLSPMIGSPWCRKNTQYPPPPDRERGAGGKRSNISAKFPTPSCACPSPVSTSKPHSLLGPNTTRQLQGAYSRHHIAIVSRSVVAASVAPVKQAARDFGDAG